MVNKRQRLELTWIGKGEEPKLEPRILIENPEYSYGDSNSGSMIIHGDNLLALKALEQDYRGKIKCIYIDPPYNTGNAFEHYDDGVEHSIWLSLMRPRLKILHHLLANDGSIIIHIDDNEFAYLKVMMDEIFGRNCFVNNIVVQDSHPSGLKLAAKDKKIIKTKSYMLVYKKSDAMRINPIYKSRDDWDTHYSIFFDAAEIPFKKQSLRRVLIDHKIIGEDFKIDESALKYKPFRNFCFANRNKIFQSTKELPNEAKERSLRCPDNVVEYNDAIGEVNYAFNGRRLFPLAKSLQNTGIDGEFKEDFAKLLCDFWDDVNFNNSQNEGGNQFPASKKPEYLIGRILTQFSNAGDYVLDSFLGSGTTAAVAHKIGRKFIGIELGEHAKTHCFPRLKAVVDGEQGGISRAVKWKGGGGFKFYNLAPSLLDKDKFGNWVISREYNPLMLAAAMAKQEGFNFQPATDTFWKQGHSSERDFIYTTSQFITLETIDSIEKDMQPGESLLICCKAFQNECKHRHSQITLKKIPHMLLNRCEFGKDDYSLNIINIPVEQSDTDDQSKVHPV
jgi:adenine-specific DNA-methyltransferase